MFISRPTTPELGYDLLVGFSNDKAGVNTFAIEVKSTQKPPGARFPIARSVFNRLAHSNIPGLLLVADVKQNRLYYAWLKLKDGNGRGEVVSLPLIEINDVTKEDFKRLLAAADDRMAAVG